MDIVIRKATPSDLDELVTLNGFVQRLHAKLEPEHFRSDVDASAARMLFAGLLERDHNHVSLAILEGRPAGYIWFETQERPSTPFTNARRRIYVHHIAVADDVRRLGVATRLMREANDQARVERIDTVVLDTWAANQGARTFFENAGFAPTNMVLRKQVE